MPESMCRDTFALKKVVSNWRYVWRCIRYEAYYYCFDFLHPHCMVDVIFANQKACFRL